MLSLHVSFLTSPPSPRSSPKLQRLLELIKPDYVHIMQDGQIVKTGATFDAYFGWLSTLPRPFPCTDQLWFCCLQLPATLITAWPSWAAL